MPRTARTTPGGYCFHVLNRGHRRAEVIHVNEEGELYLKPGTAFDHAVAQFFSEGWNVMMIMGKSYKRFQQLKRLEALKPGKTVRILWTIA